MSQIDKFNNNCTLIAVREFTHHGEDAILSAFRDNDYRENHGMYHHKWTRAATQLGLDLQKIPYSEIYNLTLAAFLKKFPEGDFFVTISGHAFNVRNGRVIDPNTGGKTRARVQTAERVLNAKQPKTGTRFKMERWPGWGKSAAKARRREAYHFVRTHTIENDRRLPEAKDVIANTSYTKADLNWDVKRGLVTLTNNVWYS